MAPICWIASYPKSGNTWVRLWLTALLNDADGFDMDSPLCTPIASNRVRFDRALEVPSAWLTPEEIAPLRASVDRVTAAAASGQWLFRKVHDAFTWCKEGEPLLGSPPGSCAIYLRRNPWDVAVSLAHHFEMQVEQAASFLERPDASLATDASRVFPQLPQFLGSWPSHVLSWRKAPLRVHEVGYETLVRDPFETFSKIALFLQLPHNAAAVQRAVETTQFVRLRDREREGGFREAGRAGRPFFRSGRVDDGLNVLLPATLERLRQLKRAVSTDGDDGD